MEVTLIGLTQYQAGDETPESLLETAGRICYRSESHGDPAAFLTARLHEGHLSLIEHASATFAVNGISRSCSHQLVRHRLASFSQESQRYVEMNAPEWIIPPAIAADPTALSIWETHMAQVAATYTALRERGIRKEDARFILPNATATRIIVTMNFRELRHFFDLRLAPAAQWEIRRLAARMLQLIQPHAPTVFRDQWEYLTNQFPDLLD